ncbi:hypothetical protein ACOME3_004058 [Neoechinorhynchus agilis]
MSLNNHERYVGTINYVTGNRPRPPPGKVLHKRQVLISISGKQVQEIDEFLEYVPISFLSRQDGHIMSVSNDLNPESRLATFYSSPRPIQVAQSKPEERQSRLQYLYSNSSFANKPMGMKKEVNKNYFPEEMIKQQVDIKPQLFELPLEQVKPKIKGILKDTSAPSSIAIPAVKKTEPRTAPSLKVAPASPKPVYSSPTTYSKPTILRSSPPAQPVYDYTSVKSEGSSTGAYNQLTDHFLDVSTTPKKAPKQLGPKKPLLPKAGLRDMLHAELLKVRPKAKPAKE